MEEKSLVLVYGIIYKCTNLVNNKVYIGQTIKGLECRKKKHYKLADKKINRYFYDAINKHKKENFYWEQIDIASSKEELDSKERFYISMYRSYIKEYGYNMTLGGDGGDTYSKLSPENKKKCSKKLSLALKGRKKPPGFGENLSKSRRGENNPNFGKPTSKKQKLAVYKLLKSERNPGKNKSKETCRKISESNKGRLPPNYIDSNKEAYYKELHSLIDNKTFKIDSSKVKECIYLVINRLTKTYTILYNRSNVVERHFYFKILDTDEFLTLKLRNKVRCVETGEQFDKASLINKEYKFNYKKYQDCRGFNWERFLGVSKEFNDFILENTNFIYIGE